MIYSLAQLFVGQLETPILERLLDYGAIGILTIIGWGLFFTQRKEMAALQSRIETMAREYASDLRTLTVNANTATDRTADAMEAMGKSLDVVAVEYRRSNDSRGLPR